MPIAYSQGFTPHPKISYASAAPTGVASEAEYLELGLRSEVPAEQVASSLDAVLSPGLDVLEAVPVPPGAGSLADRIEASHWRIELPGVSPESAAAAVAAFHRAEQVPVERVTKQGRRQFDARAAVVRLRVEPGPGGESLTPGSAAPSGVGEAPCAILDCVVRQVTPTVRPDDVLSGLRVVADLEPPAPPRVTRLAQGPLTAQGDVVDPLEADRRGMPAESVG